MPDLVTAFAAGCTSLDTLTIVGDGPQRSQLVRLAQYAGISHRVRISRAAPYAEIPTVMWRHDVLVLPSREEVWGLVVNEALAAGLHGSLSERCGVAASVAGMAGVTVCTATEAGITHAMRQQRATYKGAIPNPAMLSRTPADLAGVFEVAQEMSHVRQKLLLVIQPYLPLYRVEFFERLHAALMKNGVRLTVVAPSASGSQAARRDESTKAVWHRRTAIREVRIPGVATFRSYGGLKGIRRFDAIIAPASATNLEAIFLSLTPSYRRKLGLWGHIGAYVKAPSKLDRAIETLMMRRSRAVLSYSARSSRRYPARRESGQGFQSLEHNRHRNISKAFSGSGCGPIRE